MKNKPKIFAVASIGGHWIQLLRISKGLEENFEIVYLSTHEKCSTMVEGNRFYRMKDFSRWDFYKMIPEFFHTISLLRKEKPLAVITTGAAPGLTCLLAAYLLQIKTIWIDSVANAEHLSFSGKIASKFASRVYTQWKDQATDKIIYAGNIFG